MFTYRKTIILNLKTDTAMNLQITNVIYMKEFKCCLHCQIWRAETENYTFKIDSLN